MKTKGKGKKGKAFSKADEMKLRKMINNQSSKADEESDDSSLDDEDLDVQDDDAEDLEFGSDEEVADDENGNESDDEEDEEEKDAGSEEDESVENEGSGKEEDVGTTKQHKQALNRLKDTDPSFYKYLLQNDKELLNFEASDDDSDVDEDEKVHKPPETLAEDSEDSDLENEEEYTGAQINVTKAMVENWNDSMQSDGSLEVVAEIVKAFQSAVVQLHGKEDEGRTNLKYHFVGAGHFNSIMQTCLSYMYSSLRKILKMPSNVSIAQPMKSKRWKKARQHIKLYLNTLIQYLGLVSSEEVQATVLKHFHQMSLFVVCFPKMCKTALKLLVKLWSEGLSQPVRILAFLCLSRFACNRQNQMLEMVLKVMYVTYVRNTRFLSPSVLANVNFMRLSLVELFYVDEAAAYQQAFLYIRQLAIHLRNAVRVHKKETLQTVCNWQYVSSLQLWCTLLARTTKSSPLRMLLYPVVELTIGVVQLFSSPQYYPLRFHCAKMLTFICKCSPTFIPVLPLLYEVLDVYDFNKKHKHVSMKPIVFTCILRVNKRQQLENSFKDAIIEQIYAVALEYLASQSYSIAFPDLVVPFISHLIKFSKTCKVAAFVKKMKSLQDKMEENSKFIEEARKTKNVNLTKQNDLDAFDAFVRSKVSPLDAFYQNWRKAFEEKKVIRQKQSFDEANVPKLKKHAAKTSNDEPTELFPSDDEESDNIVFKGIDSDEEQKPAPKKKPKKTKKAALVKPPPAKKAKVQEPVDDIEEGDIVADFDLDDF
ncbi:nucleolar complex protein 2 homolog [Neocloeon triangulifer]|uniref:nucleolar complex protein 2 homolog n=1 Tax=Neocloeon triangulifer TaxID=2078957 RepID=UPI00286F54F4|nr:nucleolar complex protein 2 homolog [Neocloeon triangulifer]